MMHGKILSFIILERLLSVSIAFVPECKIQRGSSSNLPALRSVEIKSEINNFDKLFDDLYTQSSTIKCPFFKRRAADLIDSASMLIQFLYIRHKSLVFLPPPGCRATGSHVQRADDGTVIKTTGLNVRELSELVTRDWVSSKLGDTKGYYITGLLNSSIYRDDCLFDGPDPDMPVLGLRKYLDAASKLFMQSKSHAEFLGMNYSEEDRFIDVYWRLSGVLMLPWHPSVKPWTGKTRYIVDDEGLIESHIEEWDISVYEAFICTLFPDLGEKIWDPR